MSFVWHFEWSQGSDGLVELWVNGVKRAAVHGANMYESLSTGLYDVYMKQGIYTGRTSLPQTVFVDDTLRGRGREDVLRSELESLEPPSGPEPKPLTVSSIAPSDGDSVRGMVSWKAATSGDAIRRVNFIIDGEHRFTDTSAPFTFGPAGGWNTRAEVNGEHVLRLEAIGANGTSASSTIDVTVANNQEMPLLSRFEQVASDACGLCTVTISQRGITASVSGLHSRAVSAYGRRDFAPPGGWPGRVWIRDVVRLPRVQAVSRAFTFFEVRDVGNELVYELVAQPDRSIALRSPAGGLTADAVVAPTEVKLPLNGAARRVEVSALADDSVLVRIDGVDRVVLTDLQGAETSYQRYIQVGVLNHQPNDSSHRTVVRHDGIGVSAARWLAQRRLLRPRLRFTKRPSILRHNRIKVRAQTAPGARVRVVVRSGRGHELATRHIQADEAGRIHGRLRIRSSKQKILRIQLRARYAVYGTAYTANKVKRVGLTRAERRRLNAR